MTDGTVNKDLRTPINGELGELFEQQTQGRLKRTSTETSLNSVYWTSSSANHVVLEGCPEWMQRIHK
jgi:hypothetical protein